MYRKGFFLMTSSSTSIYSSEVRGIANEWGHNGMGTSPGVVIFPICGIGDMDGIEEGVRGVVGNKTSWRDGVLTLGHLIVDLQNGVFGILRHRLCPDS